MTHELTYLLLTAMLTALLWIPVAIGYVSSRGLLTPAGCTVAPTSPVPGWVQRANRAHMNAVENSRPSQRCTSSRAHDPVHHQLGRIHDLRDRAAAAACAMKAISQTSRRPEQTCEFVNMRDADGRKYLHSRNSCTASPRSSCSRRSSPSFVGRSSTEESIGSRQRGRVRHPGTALPRRCRPCFTKRRPRSSRSPRSDESKAPSGLRRSPGAINSESDEHVRP